MEKQILSKFRELPKLKISWYFFGLSLVLVFGIVILIIQIFTPIKAVTGTNPYSSIYAHTTKLIIISMIEIIIFIPNLVLGIRTYKKGEKSWILWLGFLPTTIISIYIGLNIIALILSLIR